MKNWRKKKSDDKESRTQRCEEKEKKEMKEKPIKEKSLFIADFILIIMNILIYQVFHIDIECQKLKCNCL